MDSNQSETIPTTIRIPAGLLEKADALADKLHNSRAGLIKFAIEALVGHVEKTGNLPTLDCTAAALEEPAAAAGGTWLAPVLQGPWGRGWEAGRG